MLWRGGGGSVDCIISMRRKERAWLRIVLVEFKQCKQIQEDFGVLLVDSRFQLVNYRYVLVDSRFKLTDSRFLLMGFQIPL